MPLMRDLKSFGKTFLHGLYGTVLFAALAVMTADAQALETRQIDLKGCIQIYLEKDQVIKDRRTFLKKIRNDASRKDCLKNLEPIDFRKNSLLGIELNTGYCRTPLGLKFWTLGKEAEKQYVLKIEYLEAAGSCRALSRYDLWVLVPALPAGYTVKFEVAARPNLK